MAGIYTGIITNVYCRYFMSSNGIHNKHPTTSVSVFFQALIDSIPYSLHSLIINRCMIPNCDSSNTLITNEKYESFFNKSFLKFTIPLIMDEVSADNRYDNCHQYGQKFKSSNESCSQFLFDNETIEICSSFVFDQQYFESTIVTDFQLYCHREWIVQLLQVLYFFGNLIGAVFNGILADKYVLIVSIVSFHTIICD